MWDWYDITGFIAFCLFLAIVIFAFIARFYLGLAYRRDKKQSIDYISKQKCPSCQQEYGMAVAVKAEQEYQQIFQDIIQSNLDHFVSVLPLWPVECPNCLAKVAYDELSGQLTTRVE